MYSGIFITALLMLGGTLVLGIYHLLLYLQYREKVILAYCSYLISAALYIGVYVATEYIYHDAGIQVLFYIKEVASILTVLGYTYFVFVALSEWHRHYPLFFRVVRWAVGVMLVYCGFYLVAGFYQAGGLLITTILPYASRLVMLAIAIVTAWLFFPRMNDHFLRLVKWGSVTYLSIIVLVVAASYFPGNKILGITDIYLFFAGTFIELVIFSMAMAHKVKSVLMHVMEMRLKISQDLHDDIGASLSSLQIYGTIAERTIEQNPAKAMEMVRKISAQSKLVMDNMSDIVWSMKPVGYGTASLEARIKDFGTELLRDKNIDITYSISPDTEEVLQEVQERKNILLVIKEALNNISKYSEATEAGLELFTRDKTIILKIRDNGIGFDEALRPAGNGLQHMRNRIKELGGTFSVETALGKGTQLLATVPFPPH